MIPNASEFFCKATLRPTLFTSIRRSPGIPHGLRTQPIQTSGKIHGTAIGQPTMQARVQSGSSRCLQGNPSSGLSLRPTTWMTDGRLSPAKRTETAPMGHFHWESDRGFAVSALYRLAPIADIPVAVSAHATQRIRSIVHRNMDQAKAGMGMRPAQRHLKTVLIVPARKGEHARHA